jgi:hypothetical protein
VPGKSKREVSQCPASRSGKSACARQVEAGSRQGAVVRPPCGRLHHPPDCPYGEPGRRWHQGTDEARHAGEQGTDDGWSGRVGVTRRGPRTSRWNRGQEISCPGSRFGVRSPDGWLMGRPTARAILGSAPPGRSWGGCGDKQHRPRVPAHGVPGCWARRSELEAWWVSSSLSCGVSGGRVVGVGGKVAGLQHGGHLNACLVRTTARRPAEGRSGRASRSPAPALPRRVARPHR